MQCPLRYNNLYRFPAWRVRAFFSSDKHVIRLIPDYEDRRHCCLNASREAEVFQLISLLGTTPGVQINFQAITGLQAIKIDDFMLKCRSREVIFSPSP